MGVLKATQRTRLCAKRWLLIVLALPVLIALASSFALLLHNQAQSEYFIFFDFWRNFNVLSGADSIRSYVFHNVHTYVIPSAVWYADVALANGTLKLFHTIVLAALLVGLGGLLLLTNRMLKQHSSNVGYGWVAAAAVASVFLSPSAAGWATYPLVDLIATVILASIALTALTLAKAGGKTRIAPAYWVYISVYLVVTLIAFLTLETYVVIPLMLAVDAALRRRRDEAVLHTAVAAALIFSYWSLSVYFGAGGVHATQAEISRDIGAFLHNFLLLLASHQLILLHWLKLPQKLAAHIAIGLSLIQLAFSIAFAFSHYRRGARDDSSPLIALLLIGMGVAAIVLATWLRYSETPTLFPVDRYTVYTAFFSIGVFLIAIRTLVTSNAVVMRYASALVILPVVFHLAIEAWIFWDGTYNPAADLSAGRAEMAVYAISPGDERGIGPVEPDDGRSFRGRLHNFMMERELSVFHHPAYRLLGTPAPVASESEAICKGLRATAAPNDRQDYRRLWVTLHGADVNGVFLVTDAQGIIIAFGLPTHRHPLAKLTGTLLPAAALDPPNGLLYAIVRSGEVLGAVPCR